MSRVQGDGFPDSIVKRVATLMDLQAALIRRDGWERGWREYEAAFAPYRGQPWTRPMSAFRNSLGDTSWFMPYTADIDFDPVPVIQQLRVPMLALLGANDAIVPPEETAQRLRSLQKPNLTVCIIAGANHSMSPENSHQPVAEYWGIMDRWLEGVWNASDPARTQSNDLCVPLADSPMTDT